MVFKSELEFDPDQKIKLLWTFKKFINNCKLC